MRIKILRSTVCNREAVAAGEIIDADDRDALVLLQMGKAIPAGELAPESTAVEAPEKAIKKPAGKRGKALKDGAEDNQSG